MISLKHRIVIGYKFINNIYAALRRVQYSKLAILIQEQRTKMKTILLLVIVRNTVAVLLPCMWTETASPDFLSQTYLKQPAHGVCYYQTSEIKSLPSETHSEYLVMVKNLIRGSHSLAVITCQTLGKQFEGNCTLVSDLQKMKIDRVGRLTVKIGPDSIVQALEIQFLRDRVDPLKCQNKLSVENIIISTSFKTKGILSSQQGMNIFLPFIHLLLLLFSQRKQFLNGYYFLKQLVILKIVEASIGWIIQIFEQEEDLSPIYFNLVGPVLYAVNFIIIGLSGKKYLDYIYNGTLEFESCSPNQLTQHIRTACFGEVSNKNFKLKATLSQMSKFCSKVTSKFRKQKAIVQRICKSTIFVGLYFSLQSDYLLIDALVESVIFILLPAYFGFKQVSCTSQIKSNQFDWCSKHEPRDRNSLLLPLDVISSYFALVLLKAVMIWVVCNQSLFSLFIELSLIVGLWAILTTSLYLLVKEKRQKNVRIYNFKGSISHQFWWTLWIKKLLNRHRKNITNQESVQQQSHHISCCICLSELHASEDQKWLETECGHIFHARCLSSWTKIKPACPIDRYNLNAGALRKIYRHLAINQ